MTNGLIYIKLVRFVEKNIRHWTLSHIDFSYHPSVPSACISVLSALALGLRVWRIALGLKAGCWLWQNAILFLDYLRWIGFQILLILQKLAAVEVQAWTELVRLLAWQWDLVSLRQFFRQHVVSRPGANLLHGHRHAWWLFRTNTSMRFKSISYTALLSRRGLSCSMWICIAAGRPIWV